MASHPISVFGSSSTSPCSADQNYGGGEGDGEQFSFKMNNNKATFDSTPHSQRIGHNWYVIIIACDIASTDPNPRNSWMILLNGV